MELTEIEQNFNEYKIPSKWKSNKMIDKKMNKTLFSVSGSFTKFTILF